MQVIQDGQVASVPINLSILIHGVSKLSANAGCICGAMGEILDLEQLTAPCHAPKISSILSRAQWNEHLQQLAIIELTVYSPYN